jgi:hypothetical protein
VKFDVVVDAEGGVIGTMVVLPATAEGYRTAIFPALKEHSLHRVEVSDDFAGLSATELHDRLEDHLRNAAST